MSYPDLPQSLLELEETLLQLWREEDLFRRSLEATADGAAFVFYEGPPTANGRPGLHHIISRTIKDLVCRHRTMQGRSVTRIAGWDTHGLPVEIEAERKLGISGKPDIERIGIARFNEVCRESVFTYKEEWERLSERIGYWLDYSRPYVTFHTDYIESVWWILKELAGRGLLYRGHKSVPYCPRCGTALSSHEVAQGYRDVEDPSLYFLGEILGENGEPDGRAFLAWTTTPWTVPSNTALAVHPDLTYVEVEAGGRRLILAEARLDPVLGEGVGVLATYAGQELVGLRYRRPLDLVPFPDAPPATWTVVGEEFVSAGEGTGVVHLAPAFGADDHAAGRRYGLPMVRPLDAAGRFTEDVPLVGGLFVKEADPLLVEELRRRGLLFRIETVVHSYPHCWRCESPLIHLAMDSWFAATSTLRDDLMANNREVSWYPPDVGEGRFGEWLASNVDWALSRDRYWGTPLPAWVCDQDRGHVDWIGSLGELGERAGALPKGFDPHRPYIDEITWACPECGGTMRRTPEVIDVWFDSGAMPYAQWHYPFENQDEWRRHFPADFICEGLDQTRGWFYSLMAISTMLGLGPAYRHVVVNGLILDAEGQKMSKSRGNVVDPWDAVGQAGADAVRWYLITVSNPWTAKRYDPEGVGESARRLLDTLLNTYRFFALYANAEGWVAPAEEALRPGDAATPDGVGLGPAGRAPEDGSPSLLDRWLLSRLETITGRVSEALDDYQLTRAYRSLGDFLSEDLSNWYVRRSRARFWGNTDPADGRAAFATLWHALRTVSLLLAPVTPFVADWLHRALTGRSAHVTRFPEPRAAAVDADLEREMDAVRRLVSLGRAAREEVQIRVRQPLGKLYAVLPDGGPPREGVLGLLKDELNVKDADFLPSADGLLSLVARPNYRTLGPRFQRRMEAVAAAVRGLGAAEIDAFRRDGAIRLPVDGEEAVLGADDLEILEETRGNLVVRSADGYTVALDPSLSEELLREGLARELVNRIQRLRRDAGLEITDRIRLGIFGPGDVQEAARAFEPFISGETLAVRVEVGPEAGPDGYQAARELDLDGTPARIALSRSGE